MRRWCVCGHSEGWHTEEPTERDWLTELFLILNFAPIPGPMCTQCGECKGFILGPRRYEYRVGATA